MAARQMLPRLTLLVLAGCGLGSRDLPTDVEHAEHRVAALPVAFPAAEAGPTAPVSVAAMDRSALRPASAALAGPGSPPVEARFLIVAATGSEPELSAIRSALDHRGVPHDVFVASTEPPLTASRLRSGDHGLYQATILTSSSLAVAGVSALDAAEWATLADYEASFQVRRAVLAAWPDPALGFAPATQQNTSTTPLAVRCTAAGAAVFRDVACDAPQEIRGDVAYLAAPASGAPLTPLLSDAAGHALAAVHEGSDGRETLLLLFRNQPTRLHSLLFLHGVLGWVAGGAYLGERRIDLGAQLDDLFLPSNQWGGGTYRIDDADLRAGLAWVTARRNQPSTPDFRVAFAFNGAGADYGDPLTEEVRLQADAWHWLNHTYRHATLDALDYAAAHEQFAGNMHVAGALPLLGFDPRDLVTPNVSGLVNTEVMRAAADVGIRFAVTDTSRAGCDNPSPNTAFYNALAPSILLVPRRPTNLFYNVSTPAQWVGEYNALYHDTWGRDSTYAQVLDQESDKLLHYLLRGDADPWMFHQANLRAYDGIHSLLGDLLDATLVKLAARSRVPVRTPAMSEVGERFARRVSVDTAGVRATLYRGRALLVDVARATSVTVTGGRAADGEAYGGDVIATIAAVPGTTACLPLDSAGLGCSPAPVRAGGPGTAQPLPVGICNASSVPQPTDAGVGSDGAVEQPPDAGAPDGGAVVGTGGGGSPGTATLGPDGGGALGGSGGCAAGPSGAAPAIAGLALVALALLLRRIRRRSLASRPVTSARRLPLA